MFARIKAMIVTKAPHYAEPSLVSDTPHFLAADPGMSRLDRDRLRLAHAVTLGHLDDALTHLDRLSEDFSVNGRTEAWEALRPVIIQLSALRESKAFAGFRASAHS